MKTIKSIVFLFAFLFTSLQAQDIQLLNYQSLDKGLYIEAAFPGGEEALTLYFRNFFQAFSQDIKNEINGTLEIHFIIDAKEGKVSNVWHYSSRSISQPSGFRTQGLIAVRTMPNWTPAIRNGFQVRSSHIVEIGFPEKEIITSDVPQMTKEDALAEALMMGDEPKLEWEQIHTEVEKVPEFPGGEEALNTYLRTMIIEPMKKSGDIQNGKMKVSFIVNIRGEHSEYRVVKSDCPGCKEKVLEVIEQMPAWIAGKNKGRRVPVRYELVIDFD